MNPAPPPSFRRFVPPVFAGAVLRLLFLTRQNLWIDEILTLRAASVGERFEWSDVLANPQGPLPHVWLRLWVLVLGDGDLSLRLWAALAGVATLLLAAAVFRRVLPAASLLAVWLFALSPFHIWYAQEVRNYVFLAAASLLVLGTLVAAVERPAPRRWLAHAGALTTLLLCNLSGAFLLPALALWVYLVPRRGRVGWTLAAAAALLAVSPWLLREAGANMDWRGVRFVDIPIDPEAPPIRGGERLHPGAVPYAYVSFIGGFGVTPPLRELHDPVPASTWLVTAPGLAALAAAVLVLGVGVLRRRRDPGVILFLLWVTVPMVAAAAVALLGLKAFNPRYLTAIQPVIPALLAMGGEALGRDARRWGVGLLVGVMVWGWARQTLLPAYARDDFRAAAAFLDTRAVPGDLILEQGVHGPLGRYYHGPARIETYFAGYFGRENGGRDQLASMIAGHAHVWWVGSRLWYEDPERRVEAWLGASGTEVAASTFPGVSVRGFALEHE